jgi:type IV pilus assembly protein PilC
MSEKNITISDNEKVGLFSTLATMIDAGIPILEAVDSILDGSKGNTKKIMESIRGDLVEGKSLSVAFSKFPSVFNKVTVNVVKAAEEAGTLDIVLKDLKMQLQKDMEFINSVKSAITYPIVILVLFLVVLLVILVVVVPKIAAVFIQLRVKLPLPTQILIFMSNIVIHNTIPLLVVLAVIIGGFILLFRYKKPIVLNFIYSLPLVSRLIKQIDLVRFSRSMYLLLNSGITIISALVLVEGIVLRRDVAKAVVLGRETVLSGKKISEAFKTKKNIFPGIVVKLIEAGEKTGTLEKSMEEIAEYMDYQVSSTLKTLISLLEPLMLVFVGLLVGAMMMSIIAPIYGLISQFGSVGSK